MSAIPIESSIVHRPATSRSLQSAGVWVASCVLHAAALWWLSGMPMPRGTGGDAAGTGTRVDATFFGRGNGDGGHSDGQDSGTDPSGSEFLLADAKPEAGDSIDADDPQAPSETELPSDKVPDRPGAGTPTVIFDKASEVEPDEPRASPRSARRNGAAAGAGSGRGAGTGSGRAGGSGDGAGGTTFFNVPGRGTKFVYVIDRSESMENKGRLDAAIDELLASLEELPPTAFVQVVFYNREAIWLDSADGKSPLVRNSPAQRRRIAQLAAGIRPDGGTQHLRALQTALQWTPDVVFLLTDADDPKLYADDLEKIRSSNPRRTSIHTIELGVGPLLEADNFLMRLARQNRGVYRYCNIEELSAPEPSANREQ